MIGSCSGLAEKADDAEFARRLPGAGPEALLGMAEGALRNGRCALSGAPDQLSCSFGFDRKQSRLQSVLLKDSSKSLEWCLAGSVNLDVSLRAPGRRAANGTLYAAARQAAERDPLNGAAHHALGLAAEACGSLDEATAALRTAAKLLDNAVGAQTERTKHRSTV